jgi:ElaB/YqjD/DUF883 family membrane-anchored ribosome-binding protein
MSKSPTNRLHSLWPSQAADGNPSPLPSAEQLAEKIQPLIANAGAAIAEHPRTSLTVAATLGVVLGWFIKRK